MHDLGVLSSIMAFPTPLCLPHQKVHLVYQPALANVTDNNTNSAAFRSAVAAAVAADVVVAVLGIDGSVEAEQLDR